MLAEAATVIVSTLAAGAIAKMEGLGGTMLVDAYEALKRILVDGYKLTTTSFLEKKPKDDAAKKVVEDEIKESGADKGKDVLSLVEALSAAIERLPSDQLARVGLSVSNIKAYRNAIIRNLEAEGPVTIENIIAEQGDAIIENIKAKKN